MFGMRENGRDYAVLQSSAGVDAKDKTRWMLLTLGYWEQDSLSSSST